MINLHHYRSKISDASLLFFFFFSVFAHRKLAAVSAEALPSGVWALRWAASRGRTTKHPALLLAPFKPNQEDDGPKAETCNLALFYARSALKNAVNVALDGADRNLPLRRMPHGPQKGKRPDNNSSSSTAATSTAAATNGIKEKKKKKHHCGARENSLHPPTFCWYANVASRWAYYVAVAAAAAAAVATLDVAAVRQSLNAFFILLLIWVFYVLCGSCRCDF